MFPHPVISCLNERLDPHRAGSTIALAIHSFEGISIAFANRSVDPAGAFRGWCAVRTLQNVLFKQVLKRLVSIF